MALITTPVCHKEIKYVQVSNLATCPPHSKYGTNLAHIVCHRDMSHVRLGHVTDMRCLGERSRAMFFLSHLGCQQ